MFGKQATALVVLALMGGLAGCQEDSSVSMTREMEAKGAKAFERCKVCHTMGSKHFVGPGLAGVFGRQAGGAPEYGYSDALRTTQVVWTTDTVDRWLAGPDAFIPNSNMVIEPITDPQTRAALIGWMRLNGG